MMVRNGLAMSLLALALIGCGPGSLSEEDRAKIASLQGELIAVRAEIAGAEEQAKHYSGGLLKGLAETRLEVLKTNRALIEQRIHAIESGAPVTQQVSSQEPDLARVKVIEAEIAALDAEIKAAKADADQYAGGIIKAVKLSTIATQEQSMAMLQQSLLTTKYGLAFQPASPQRAADKPVVAKTEQEQAAAAVLPAGEGPFGLEMGLSVEAVEKMIGARLTPIEGVPNLYSAPKVPKSHPDLKTFALLISPTLGLCEIRAAGPDIETNRHGFQIRDAFDKLEGALSANYGQPKRSDMLVPGSIWDDPQDWMMAIVQNDRILQSMWSIPETGAKASLQKIYLQVNAKSGTEGFLRVQYNFANQPSCSAEIDTATRGAL